MTGSCWTDSPFKGKLSADALGWLLESRGGSPLHLLTLEDSAYVEAHAGHRADRARVARIRSVAGHLEQHPKEALDAADAPSLWSNGRFLSDVADWMSRQGSLARISRGIAAQIDARIDGEPESVVRAPRALVRELLDEGYPHAAKLLGDAVYQEVQKESLAELVIQALLAGHPGALCWPRLADQISRAQAVEASPPGRHPLLVIADQIRAERRLSREERRQLRGDRLAHVRVGSEAQSFPDDPTALHEMGLPVFDLAASLLGPGALGRAALQVIFAPASRGRRGTSDWWRALLRALCDFRRQGQVQSSDDRKDMALALVSQHLRSLERLEQQAFLRALQLEAEENPREGLFSEFGARKR